MTFIHAIILGIVEGITEFLPISSTGHLILSGKVLGLDQTEFLKTFEIVIQLGAILAVVVLYWKRLWNWGLIKKVVAGFLPTAVIGVVLYPYIKNYLFASPKIVAWSLLLGGVALVLFEYWHKEQDSAARTDEIMYQQAVMIGVFQILAMVPGTSRAAATILGGLIVGLRRVAIVEFSFFLAIPTMLGASTLDLVRTPVEFDGRQVALLLTGFIVSFLVALLAIKFLVKFIQNHSFISFGIYRIILAIIFLSFVI